jgi:RpiB/LacA/LacB family sugar-phosphate isomerase
MGLGSCFLLGDTRDDMAQIYITADHGGFELKNKLREHLQAKGYLVTDLGPEKLDMNDDYPDYAKRLTDAIQADPQAMGIAICRTSEGMCMAINRATSLRAASAWNVEIAKKSREHNDANALCLSADVVDDDTNVAITEAWLSTPFSGDERHVRRLKKIDALFK